MTANVYPLTVHSFYWGVIGFYLDCNWLVSGLFSEINRLTCVHFNTPINYSLSMCVVMLPPSPANAQLFSLQRGLGETLY